MQNRFVISILVWLVYIVIVMIGPKLQFGNDPMSLSELTSRQFVVSLAVAMFFLFAAVVHFRWGLSVGLKKLKSTRSLIILWPPALFIIGFFALGAIKGFPPLTAILFVGINTLMVGIGEELGFRGVLFSGALSKFSVLGAIVFTTVVFGSVHALNGFLTGDFVGSSVQAVAAGMSGLWFIAILIRTGSIIPGMIVHFLWDYGIFLMTASADAVGEVGASAEPGMVFKIVGPLLFVTPLFLYGLWLLRGVSKTDKEDLLY